MSRCRFISFNKCITLLEDVDNGGRLMNGGKAEIGKL